MEESKPASPLRELYPALSDEQLREAEENLDQYLNLARRIYDRLTSDPEAHAQWRALLGTAGTLT